MTSARSVVLKMLIRMENNAYSNLVLGQTLNAVDLSEQDKKFACCLFYGVIERRITLDYIVSCYSSKSISKLNAEVLNILRIGLYQLLYMPSVPESAAVNECVKLAKYFKMHSACGFVNAVLRSFIRDKKEVKLPKDKISGLSIKYSCPEWLVLKWQKEYGIDNLTDILNSTVSEPETAVRVNTTKISTDDLIIKLREENIKSEKYPLIKDCLILKNNVVIEKCKAYKNGYFHVQDISSQLCCMALGCAEGDFILDLCAAPGGKTFTIAELINDNGKILAFDLHQKRVDLISSGSQILGLKSILASVGNAKEYNENLINADRILCDVPCSGLGVISKKPEIKYKNPEDLKSLPEIQYSILENAAQYLKIGGELVYSTCSLSLEENDFVIDRFLSEHKNYEGIDFLSELRAPFGTYKATIMPMRFSADGFFISKIRRIG